MCLAYWLCSVFLRACNRLADKLSYIKALRLATVLNDGSRLQGAASGLVVGEIDRGVKFFDGVDPLHFPRSAGLSIGQPLHKLFILGVYAIISGVYQVKVPENLE